MAEQLKCPVHGIPDCSPLLNGCSELTAAVPVRDSQGRDTRIHGMVLDEANPARSLRELLRQWVEHYEVGDDSVYPAFNLAERSREALKYIGPDGTAVQ